MEVAIVHDELLRKGGAERVVISIHKLFPQADIFTSAYNPETTFDYFKGCTVKTSFLNYFVRNEKVLMAVFFPLGILSFKLFDFSRYDLVIISSAHGAQYIRKPKKAYCINYVHYLFRFIWEPETYGIFKQGGLNRFFAPLFRILQSLDRKLTVEADYVLFNSRKTQKSYTAVFRNITRYSILNPPVPLENFYISNTEKSFFLVVSRFEPYKKVDLVIKAFNQLPAEKLIIVGSGTKEAELKQLVTHTNITFEKNVSAERLKDLYANCKALVFPQVEDFGITPLECNASGRPVIAYKKGGILESMSFDEDVPESNSVFFFEEQTVESLLNVINRFDESQFHTESVKKNAERFTEKKFHSKLKKVVHQLMSEVN